MKKVKRIFLLSACTVLLFTACNNSDNTKNSASTTSDSTAVKDTNNAHYNPATPGAQNGQ